MSIGPSVSSWFISLLAVVIGRQNGPSDALTGTVVIKPIKGTPAWPPAQPSA